MSSDLDERFDAVDEALIEQRQCIEFAFDQLTGEMRNGLEAMNRRLDRADARFDSVESRFDSVESRFDRLERRIDQFIEAQATANRLTERRLEALVSRSPQR